MNHGRDLSSDNTHSRSDYLVECHRSGHEELMFRVTHRDSWIKLQMLVQATFLALSSGVEIAGVKASSNLPNVLALALPTSLTLTCLYVVEDRLIGLISRYIGRLSDLEARLAKSDAIIEYVGSSPEIREFANFTLPMRLIAQIFSFIVVPTFLSIYRIGNFSKFRLIQYIEVTIDITCLFFIVIFLIISYRERKHSGRAEPETNIPIPEDVQEASL